ncbi:MAG: VCBS repeat-containing protein [Limnochordaceae bacterium]|nr:VCBS repeat-containing protein [Limnochordaceae bacterium]
MPRRSRWSSCNVLLALAERALPALLHLAVLAAPVPASARGWERLGTQVAPAPAVLQLAAADLDGDGRAELVMVGRDYERQEARLYVLTWPGALPQGAARNGPGESGQLFHVAAASPPFAHPLSHVTLAVGPFTRPQGPEILVATNSHLVVWHWTGGKLERAWEGNYSARVQDLAPVELPGEPAALALVYVETKPAWHYLLRVWHWNGNAMEPVAGPFPIGPVRAMSSGDLGGDGESEVVVETGEGNKGGRIEVWRWTGSAFVQAGSAALRDAPAFGLEAGRVPEVDPSKDLLLVADDKGRTALYEWTSKGFSRVGGVVTLGWSLGAATLGDLDGDGRTEAVVAEYPNLLHVLRWVP